MRRSFAISGLFHAGVLLFAIGLCVRPRPSRRQPGPRLTCHQEPSPAPLEVLPVPPLRVERPQDPPEEILPDAPEPEFEEFTPFSAPEWKSAEPPRLCVRLPRPLRAPARGGREAPPPKPVAAPETARRPAPRGPTRQPVLLDRAAAVGYPRLARRRGLEGSVELRILVGAEGSVQRVEVARSSGHAILDDAAKSAARGWRFAPALRDGRAVAAWTRRVIRFQLTERSLAPE